MINNVNFDILRKLNQKPTSPSDCLPYDETGKLMLPFYDFLLAAKASIDTYTKFMGGNITQGGALGCAVGMSIVYLRAAGHYLNYKTSVDYLTVDFGEKLDKDTINWKKLDNWKDAQPGDFINTKTAQGTGHIGIVSDTKDVDDFLFNQIKVPKKTTDPTLVPNPYFNPDFKKYTPAERNRLKTWDIISNSGGGFVGGIGGIDTSKNGSIQVNYSIYKWGLPCVNKSGDEYPQTVKGVATRKGVGPTNAYRFIGTWETTIGWTCCSRSNPKNRNLPKPK